MSICTVMLYLVLRCYIQPLLYMPNLAAKAVVPQKWHAHWLFVNWICCSILLLVSIFWDKGEDSATPSESLWTLRLQRSRVVLFSLVYFAIFLIISPEHSDQKFESSVQLAGFVCVWQFALHHRGKQYQGESSTVPTPINLHLLQGRRPMMRLMVPPSFRLITNLKSNWGCTTIYKTIEDQKSVSDSAVQQPRGSKIAHKSIVLMFEH